MESPLPETGLKDKILLRPSFRPGGKGNGQQRDRLPETNIFDKGLK